MPGRWAGRKKGTWNEPLGIFRAVQKPTYEGLMMEQIAAARQKNGPGRLEDLFRSGETWEVRGE